MPTTIILIHPREIIRLGILSVLENQSALKVVGQGSNGKDAVKLTKQHEPDLILLYDQLETVDSFDLAKKLLGSHSNLRIVMIGIEENSTRFARAAAAGVHDYLFEGSTGRQIIDTIKNAAVRKVPSPSTGYGKVLASMRDRSSNPAVDLTPRELQVLRHVGYGLSNDEIANSLEISLETVKEHVANILRKMEMKDRTQAAVWAVREGLV
jgi:DNA-binding NarL/FixJ family response regulator